MATPPVTRRRFLGELSAAAISALALTPRLAQALDRPASAKKLGVALVGLGNYSRGQLGPALRETQYCQLAGVVTGDPAKGAKWARDYGFPKTNVYSYDTMARLADNPAIDIVYVVTPNGLHAEHCIAAAKAGKHVICEKPMGNSVADCDAIIAACQDAGVKLSVGYRLFFDPYHIELMRLAREKDFGALLKTEGDFGFVMGNHQWRATKKLAGGGPLMDLGVYLIQAGCMVAGGVAPVAVTAQVGPKTRPDLFAEVEETISWTMEFASGQVSKAVTSYSHNRNQFRAEGAKGWVEFKENAFMYYGLKVETSRGSLNYPKTNQQALQMDGFAQCMLTGRPTPVPGEMGRRDLAIIEAIYASAANGGKRTEVKL
jgi:glucose-fructose oxidoreductase